MEQKKESPFVSLEIYQGYNRVAFFSLTLQSAEIRHASIENEAQSIIETIRHWKHFLTGRHFSIKTDQRSVAYMFNNKQRGKIKNNRIMRWRMELSCYSFDTVYRPGAENITPDTFSQSFCVLSQLDLTLLTFIIRFVTLELSVCSTSCRLRNYHSL